MPRRREPTKADLLARIEELETEELRLRRELVFYRGLERWVVYGTVTTPTGNRRAVTTEHLGSYEEARVEVVKAALRGKVVAVIVRLPFGAAPMHKEDARSVAERFNNGRAWWE